MSTLTVRQSSDGTSFAPSKELDLQLAIVEERLERLALLERLREPGSRRVRIPKPTWVWGVPFSTLTLDQTLYLTDLRIRSREPGYFITANLNWVMLTDETPELQQVNQDAAFIVADGMPMVWYSRLLRNCRRIPERVTGSQLIYRLNEWAADRGHRVFFLGAGPGIADTAAERLCRLYPNLQVAGTECPPFRKLTDDEESSMIARIRDSKPDILYVAFGQPRGEQWIHQHYKELDVPMCVQVGASFDFVAGKVPRAPKIVQSTGMEWAYRMWNEPRRLAPRYRKNATFLARAMARELMGIGRSGVRGMKAEMQTAMTERSLQMSTH